jgi:hypothetical protein
MAATINIEVISGWEYLLDIIRSDVSAKLRYIMRH